ncbi:MAG: hypothetical protein IE921_11365 [Rhodobacteraceae bacterium]|nr:hypothetical protein [Paracoccaceae bacterium]
MREASQSLLDVAHRNVNVRGQEARLWVTAQIAEQATVESAEFLFVHTDQIGGGDKLRHGFSPCLEPRPSRAFMADKEQGVRDCRTDGFASVETSVEKPLGLRRESANPLQGCP